MKTVYALLIAALFTTAACGKKKEEAAKTDPTKDQAMKPTETPKADPATPDPAKPADPAMAGGSTMTVDEAGTKMTAMMDKVGAAVTGAGGDCAKMGASLKALTPEVKALMEAGKGLDADPAKKKEFDTKYGEKVMKSMSGWMPAAEKCKDNAEVKEFFSSMG